MLGIKTSLATMTLLLISGCNLENSGTPSNGTNSLWLEVETDPGFTIHLSHLETLQVTTEGKVARLIDRAEVATAVLSPEQLNQLKSLVKGVPLTPNPWHVVDGQDVTLTVYRDGKSQDSNASSPPNANDVPVQVRTQLRALFPQ
jgi:hypothetical protein